MANRYEIVQQDILKKIGQGIYKENEALPTELQMVDYYHVSRTTIQKAMRDLVGQGILQRIAGKGTFLKSDSKSLSVHYVGDFFSIIVPSHCPEQITTIQGAQQYIHQRGYNLTVHFSDRGNNEIEVLQNVVATDTKGILALLYNSHTSHKQYLFSLQRQGVPIVFLDREIYGITSNVVMSNNFNGMYSAVAHLIEYGHKKIGYFSYNTHSSTCNIDRFRGYCQCLSDHNIPLDPDIVVIDLKRQEDIIPSIERICTIQDGVTAVACAMDELAMHVYNWAGKHGVSIPDQLSVTGFDHTVATRSLLPPLTTVEQDFYQMGYTAAHILCDLYEDKTQSQKVIQLPTKLLINHSVKKL